MPLLQSLSLVTVTGTKLSQVDKLFCWPPSQRAAGVFVLWILNWYWGLSRMNRCLDCGLEEGRADGSTGVGGMMELKSIKSLCPRVQCLFISHSANSWASTVSEQRTPSPWHLDGHSVFCLPVPQQQPCRLESSCSGTLYYKEVG